MLRMLEPGLTCWRIAHAARLALLIDNDRYFSAVRSSLERAQHSVMLMGWQFDPRTPLDHSNSTSKEQTQIGQVLNRIAGMRPSLRIRLLIWDMSLAISAGRALYPQRARGWFDGNVEFVLDGCHPLGASRHQKLVIIDEHVAFCSGSDFVVNRWDSACHLEHDSSRRLPSGKMYRPRHAISVVVSGGAARALAHLFEERWRELRLDPCSTRPCPQVDAWAEHVTPDLTSVDVGIARTEPRTRKRDAILENEALHLTAIAGAQRLIYLENQYFASARIAQALAARLQERNGPEVVLVCASQSPILFDRVTMDAPRDALLRALQRVDRYRRFRAYAPVTLHGSPIVVHSKVCVIDDRLLRIGSSNLNNRSLGFDSECDIAIDAASVHGEGREQLRASIRALRATLIAHHLNVTPQAFARVEASSGSFHQAIEVLQDDATGTLQRLSSPPLGWFSRLIARHHLGDPEGSGDTWRPWRRTRTELC